MAKKQDKVAPCEFCAGATISYETMTKRRVIHCPRCLYRKHYVEEIGWVIDQWPTCPQCGEEMTGVDVGEGAGFEIMCPECGRKVFTAGAVAPVEEEAALKVEGVNDGAEGDDLFHQDSEAAAPGAAEPEIPAEVPLPEERKE